MLDKVVWAIEGQVLLVKYHDVVIRSEIYQATQEMRILLDSAPHPQSVYILFDAVDVTSFNTDMTVSEARQVALQVLRHPAVKHIVFAYKSFDNVAVSAMTDIVARLLRLNLKTVSTREQVLKFLSIVEPSLSLTELQTHF
jgi:hypothetical protein